MKAILVDVNLHLTYDRCYTCGRILICHCTTLHGMTLDDIEFMFSLLEHKVPHSWKRTGPSRCHRMCLRCQGRLSALKSELASSRPVRRAPMRYLAERLPDFLAAHGLGHDWKFDDG